jgi:uncharacterized protein (TIGR02611 family)
MDTGVAGGANTANTADGEGPGAAEKPSAERQLGSRAPAFIRRSRPLHITWQIGVGIVGFAIIIAGIIMLPLPGPGWVVIFAGLAVLGTEFVWAQRTLIWTKDQATKAAQRALDPKTRRRNMIMLTVGIVLLAAAAGVYLWRFGLALPN